LVHTGWQYSVMKPNSAYFGPVGRLIVVVCVTLSVLMLGVRVQRIVYEDHIWSQRSEKLVSVVVSSLARRPQEDHDGWLKSLSIATGRLIVLVDDEHSSPNNTNVTHTRRSKNIRSFVASIPNNRAHLQIDVPQEPEPFVAMLSTLIRWDLESMSPQSRLEHLNWLSSQLYLPVHFESGVSASGLNEGAVSIDNEGVVGISRGRDTVIVGPMSVAHGWSWHHLVVCVLLAASVGMGLGFYLFRPYQRQLRAMSLAAQDISRGVLDTRVSEDTTSDWVGVSKSFNRMAQQVEELLSIQQEMLSAVSHELRTPVARIRFGLEMIQDVTDESLAPFFSGLDADIEELDRLIDEIITYAKLHRGRPRL